MRPGDRATVDCVDLDTDGMGVGGEQPRLHVAGALPGERVDVTVAHLSPHAPDAWARLERVERPSPERRAPACAAFGACGGCLLQHWDIAAQRAWKRARVAGALAVYPSLAAVPVEAAVASPRALGYRNRSKLVPTRAGGRFVLGAYAPRSHEVVDLAGCRINEPPLEAAASALRALCDDRGVVPYDEATLTGDLRHVHLQANAEGRVLAVWVVRRALPDGEALARAFREACPEVAGVVAHLNPARGNAIFAIGGETRRLDGAESLEESIEVDGRPLRLRLSAGAFFQANRDVAARAYTEIVRTLAVKPGERVVDAYCGVGGIALSLARSAGEVIGIEAAPAAVADAAAAAARGGVTNARFVAGDAARALAALDRVDAVVLNPPRRGCAPEVLAEVLRLAPRAVAYLSCEPGTLARDLAWLASRGYRTRAVTPFDMLPHTPHVEALAYLER